MVQLFSDVLWRCRQHQELKGQPGGRHRCRFPHRPDHRSHLPMGQCLHVHCWGQAHRQLWAKLRHAGRAVEVFAVAWDQQHLDRTQRLLQTWTRGAPPLLSWPLPGLGMIDDFHLWGSRRCRRIGVHFTSVGLATWTGHDFDHHNASLSEGGALAVGVRVFSETPHGTQDNTDFPRPMRKSDARLRLACPPSPVAPHERGAGGRSDPPLVPHQRPKKGVAPSTSDPCRKAIELARKPTAKNSRPQTALRPREARLEDAHHPIAPIRSTGRLPLHLTASDYPNLALTPRPTCPRVTVRSGRDGLDPDEVGGACNRRRSAGSARYASPGRRMDSTA